MHWPVREDVTRFPVFLVLPFIWRAQCRAGRSAFEFQALQSVTLCVFFTFRFLCVSDEIRFTSSPM